MEILVLLLFCIILFGGVILGVPTAAALFAGLLLFIAYGLYKKHSLPALLRMCLKGVKTIRALLFVFMLVGILTGVWRQSGVIPTIICYTSGLIRPAIFYVVVFILNCMVSVLTGTAFGTSATMGVISMSICNTMGMSVVWTGGCVLGGAFFGDRCSPLSTSAMLVSSITGTSIYNNIRNMIRTTIVPFVIVCIIYLIAGFSGSHGDAAIDVYGLFHREFMISPACFIPPAAIICLALFKVKVQKSMSVNIVMAALISIFVQGASVGEVLHTAVFGYQAADPELARMVNGGGLVSMINVTMIVCIACCYSGLFEGTGLLDFLRGQIRKLSDKISPVRTMILVSVPVAALACNQTLNILLTKQLCEDLGLRKEEMALALEDSAVVTACLIPWSIACSVPLSMVDAPMTGALCACFLYVLPIYRLLRPNVPVAEEH